MASFREAAVVWALCGMLAAVAAQRSGKEREYFVGIVEELWNYSPNMRNEITDTDITANSPEAQYVIQSSDRIGSVYKKAMYREYTDGTYTTQVDRPAWLGAVGPLLYGEVGDVILLRIKNLANREYGAHPHGVFYLKNSEGAVYEDNTSGSDKDDERIAPGDTFTYRWVANERAGPAEGGPNCVPWPYHSHIESAFGTNTGVVGFMLICRRGILDDNNRRTDVEDDFVLMFTVTDENLSYYLDENIADYTTDPNLDKDNEAFKESNRMDSVNGYLYGALPGLDICLGDRVAWHILVMGTEIDVHTVHFHGNMLELRNHRVDSVSVAPALISSADMLAVNPGTWLAKSHVVTHVAAGAQALYRVNPDCGPGYTDNTPTGQTREFFIGVSEDVWNYGPTGVNGLDGTSLVSGSTTESFFASSNTRIGGSYKKARFVEYQSGDFSPGNLVTRGPDEEHMGILGPAIRAEVGDTIRVTFKNTGSFPYSIRPRGVRYDKSNEGMEYNDQTTGSAKEDGNVAPGNTYVYTWTVPEAYGPTDLDPDCLTFPYTSAVDETADLYSGLVGPMLICKPGTLNAQGKQSNVDREFFLLFLIFDENFSNYIDQNIADYAPGAANMRNAAFEGSNRMTGINGFDYANLPGLTMEKGETVSWHIMDLGKDTDQHTAYFHQSTFVIEGRRLDSVPLFPGMAQTVLSVPDNPGTWLIECETNKHIQQGMSALYTVTDSAAPDQSIPADANMRTYYIAAVEVEWDYTPVLYDPVKSQPLTDEDSNGYIYVTRSDTRIGSVYRKAVYREFTDDTFTTQVERTSNEDMSLGILGPAIHIEVGETLRVVFKNMASRGCSIHPENLFSTKSNEGAVYGDDSTSDDEVSAGDTRTYTWTVPESRAPTEGTCMPSMYYSRVRRTADTNSGLVGPLIICRSGTLGDDNRRTDVDKEFNLFFSVIDENKSWYLQTNIDTYCGNPSAVNRNDLDFQISNRMYGINGLLFNNLNHLDMTVGERVIWNLISLGDEIDVHTVHFHGHTVVYQTEHGNRLDVSELFPGSFVTVEMELDDPGIWLLHCHVNDHMMAGMEAFYTVHERATTPSLTLTTSSTPTNPTTSSTPTNPISSSATTNSTSTTPLLNSTSPNDPTSTLPELTPTPTKTIDSTDGALQLGASAGTVTVLLLVLSIVHHFIS